MTFIDPAPLERAIRQMVDQITDEPLSLDDEAFFLRSEKRAKVISLYVKAVQDITAHNARHAAQEEDGKHLSYDDLPPPSPEDRARFVKRLTHLYNRLNEQAPLPSAD